MGGKINNGNYGKDVWFTKSKNNRVSLTETYTSFTPGQRIQSLNP